MMETHICYKKRLLTLQYKGSTVRKKLGPPPGYESETSQHKSMDMLTIPARTEMIVRLPVNIEPHVREGLVAKSELLTGVYLADSLVKVNNGYVITSVLNTREQEIEIPNPKMQLHNTTAITHITSSEIPVYGVHYLNMSPTVTSPPTVVNSSCPYITQ
jgi:hypothetical protein